MQCLGKLYTTIMKPLPLKRTPLQVPRGLTKKKFRKCLKTLLNSCFSNQHRKKFLCSLFLKNGITKKLWWHVVVLWIFKMTLKITPRVLQIDYAQAYQCELQHEIMKALWTKCSVNLFTCAIYNNSQTKTLVFGTSYKGQDNFLLGYLLKPCTRNTSYPMKLSRKK